CTTTRASRAGPCSWASVTSSDRQHRCVSPGGRGFAPAVSVPPARCARVAGRKHDKNKNKRKDALMSTAPRTETTLPTVDARIYPRGGLDILSREEVARLKDASSGGLHDLLRRCALAVLTSGSA